MVIFHSYVKSPEGTCIIMNPRKWSVALHLSSTSGYFGWMSGPILTSFTIHGKMMEHGPTSKILHIWSRARSLCIFCHIVIILIAIKHMRGKSWSTGGFGNSTWQQVQTQKNHVVYHKLCPDYIPILEMCFERLYTFFKISQHRFASHCLGTNRSPNPSLFIQITSHYIYI